MDGGTISGNTATDIYGGGGVYISTSGSFTMNGGTISGNNATQGNSAGGGVLVGTGSSFTMNAGKISNNTAGRSGGGVYVMNIGLGIGNTFTMKSGTISGNKVKQNGGGVGVGMGNTFTMSGGTISGNTADGNGGGVDVTGGSIFTMNGGTISGNNATGSVSGNGGGVYVGGSTFTLDGGTISGNTAMGSSSTGGGGGVYVMSTMSSSSSTFTMKSGTISGNTAQSGGGVYVMSAGTGSSTFTMMNGEISGNKASQNGGGVGVSTGSSIAMSGGTISGNTAADNGGGVYVTSSGSFFTMSDDAAVDQDNEVYLTIGSFINVTGTLNGGAKNITILPAVPGTKVVQLPGGAIEADYKTCFSLSSSPLMTGMKLRYNSTGPIFELAHAYTVTVINGTLTDTGTPTGSYVEGENVNIMAEEKAGKEFVNWTAESEGVTFDVPASSSTSFTMKGGPVNVTATYKEAPVTPTVPTTVPTTVTPTPGRTGGGNMENSFRVIFDTRGGNSIPPATGLSYGDSVPRPADPVRDGYTFGGWYLDEDGTKAWNFADTILGDMTLYAKWVNAATPTPTATQTVQPTSQPTGSQPTTQPTAEPPQPTGDEGSKPAGSILPLLGGIFVLILVFLLFLFLLFRHTVTFLIPAADGIEQYRIKIWHGKHINVDELPDFIRTSRWYRDQGRNDAWDFKKDRVRKSTELYLG